LAGVKISNDLLPGVIQISTGAWWDPENPGQSNSLCKHGHVNVLTIDKGSSSLAQGSIALTCLVDVEKYLGIAGDICVFNPPTMIDTTCTL
jgi:anaerobic selenocysteine-containing dehydrogenase